MVIVTVALVEQALLRQVGESRPSDAPTFFFIDIQPDQVEGMTRLLRDRSDNLPPTLTPLVFAGSPRASSPLRVRFLMRS